MAGARGCRARAGTRGGLARRCARYRGLRQHVYDVRCSAVIHRLHGLDQPSAGTQDSAA